MISPFAQASRSRWSSASAKKAVLGVLILYIALATIPELPGLAINRLDPNWSIDPYWEPLDPSWQLGLNLAQRLHLVHGRDIVWTWGPLGYLQFVDPTASSNHPHLLYLFSLHALWIATMARIVFLMGDWSRSLWCLTVFGTIGVLNSWSVQLAIPLTTLAMLCLVERTKWRHMELAVLGFLSGLALLLKANLGIEGALLLVAIGVALIFRERDTPRALIPGLVLAGANYFLAVLVLFWLLSGDLRHLLSYLSYSYEIVQGYSEGMSSPGLWLFTVVSSFMISAILIGLPMVARKKTDTILALLPCLITIFMAWKHAFVREDVVHVRDFTFDAAFAAMFLYLNARSRSDRRDVVVVQAAILLVGILLLHLLPYDFQITDRLRLKHASRALSLLRNGESVIANSRLNSLVERMTNHVPQQFRDTIQQGTVESIPWNTAEVAANKDWQWRPRPVFQTYSAYTPRLDELNATYLRSPNAADSIIVRWQPIDDRHPFFVDPASWRTMLTMYDLAIEEESAILLTRGKSERCSQSTATGTTMVTGWGETVLLPRVDRILQMDASVTQSIVGNLRNLFYHGLPMYVAVSFESGRQQQWRAIRQNLTSGVIVHPFPSNLADLASMFRGGEPLADHVKSISFEAASQSEFLPTIEITWSEFGCTSQ